MQDAYSLRCTPQVHGAARDTLAHARTIAERELDAAIDNPMILPDGRVESCGNFHGAPLGVRVRLPRDRGRRAVGASPSAAPTGCSTPPARTACRRSCRPTPGVNCGLMIAHYTQAAMAIENQRLAVPASVDSRCRRARCRRTTCRRRGRRPASCARRSTTCAGCWPSSSCARPRGIDLRAPLAAGGRHRRRASPRCASGVAGPGPTAGCRPSCSPPSDCSPTAAVLDAVESAIGAAG